MIRQLAQGPYLLKIGTLFQPDLELRISAPGDGSATLLKHRRQPSYPVLPPSQDAAQRTDLSPAWMRHSGVMRASSAARGTLYAATLGQALCEADRSRSNCGQIGIGVSSTTACSSIAWKFEASGLSRGWEHADTMLMPASIPTAVTTQVAAATDQHGAAIAFHGGALGISDALAYAHAFLGQRRGDAFLVIGVDERDAPHGEACAALATDTGWPEGCSGILLSQLRPQRPAWRIGLLAEVPQQQAPNLPAPWSSRIDLAHSLVGKHVIGTSSRVGLAIWDAIEAASTDHALLKLTFGARASRWIGLVQD